MSNATDTVWHPFEPAGTYPAVGDSSMNIRTGTVRGVVMVRGREIHHDDGMICGIRCYGNNPELYQYRIFKRPSTPCESAKFVENDDISTGIDQKVRISPEKTEKDDLFSLASDRMGLRQEEYGLEDAFQDIADRWNLYIFQRFGVEIDLTSSDAADMLLEFKTARRLVRKRAGMKKRDDNVDRAGYIWWSDKLEAE